MIPYYAYIFNTFLRNYMYYSFVIRLIIVLLLEHEILSSLKTKSAKICNTKKFVVRLCNKN